MKNTVRKLIASALLLAILSVMMVAVSYAWTTLSTSPTVNGIQISIGGTDTIKIAPNKTAVVNGEVYNYPGSFNDTLNFGYFEEYGYLSSVEGLVPVSTADGLHWVIPTYYGVNDPAVINGEAKAGDLKPINNFLLDTELRYANLQDPEKATYGHYIYLDFWVVAPADYDLRLASGDSLSGSYLIELPGAVEEDGAYTLVETDGSVAASARVGFLVDHTTITDNTMVYYQQTTFYSNQYKMLRGNYQESGESIKYSSGYIFTIYEPNGNLHPYESNQAYVPTYPIGWDGEFKYVDISDRLAVQLKSEWIKLGGDTLYLDQVFRTATNGKTYASALNAQDEFYIEYLQGEFIPYLTKGSFIRRTSELYDAISSGAVSSEALESVELSGAAEDTCIAHLEKNIPQRIRMFVWIEGTDADCFTSGESVSFALNLELAGSNVSKNERKEENQ